MCCRVVGGGGGRESEGRIAQRSQQVSKKKPGPARQPASLWSCNLLSEEVRVLTPVADNLSQNCLSLALGQSEMSNEISRRKISSNFAQKNGLEITAESRFTPRQARNYISSIS